MYDIAVIGLGPAGANFARLIDSRRYKVAALDRKDILDPEKCQKPCGGLLSPGAQRSLASFNLPLPGEIVSSPQIFYVKTIDTDNGLICNYQRFYLNISRPKFDHWMLSLIPGSVDVYDNASVTRIDDLGEYFDITFLHGGKAESLSAKYIIGADGANSFVLKHFFSNSKKNLRLCIQEWFRQNDQKPFFSCIFDSESSDSYSWSLSKDGYFIFGGAYPVKNALKAFEFQKTKLAGYGFSLPVPEKREACFVCRLHSPADFHLGKGRVFMIGEAARFISPSSFEGISGALDSSYILSSVFNSGRKNILKSYKRSTLKLRIKYSLKIIKADILCSRFLRMLVMKSKLKNIRVDG